MRETKGALLDNSRGLAGLFPPGLPAGPTPGRPPGRTGLDVGLLGPELPVAVWHGVQEKSNKQRLREWVIKSLCHHPIQTIIALSKYFFNRCRLEIGK